MFELTTSIAGLVASFKKLKRPLTESHEKVPQATDQLDKISEQTEAATNQMLDRIEQITQREDELIKYTQQVKDKVQAGETAEVIPMIDTIADMANCAWYGALVLENIYDSEEFLDVKSYTNVVRWAKEVSERPAFQRGRRVNKAWGPEEERVIERHSASDLD